MPDDPRVQELLDELLDLETTPEEVCASCPELLPVVRERWRQICRTRAKLDALLPVWQHGSLPSGEELPLPSVPGYEVEAVLGSGGMGVVFEARHLRLGRLVALKMTLAGVYAGSHERERFRREAEAIAALRHANVVQIFDVGDWAGRPYFTMELIEGGSLGQRLEGAPQPARQAAALLATLADAVHAAHLGGIIHRDLKPSNILFTPDGTPKVTDFGLARRLESREELTLSGVPLGTPSYMAPEQARGESRTIGPAVDIYALGAILYELLTGRPPFRAETSAETILQVIDQDPVPPARLNANVPRDLEVICLKCLSKEASRRYLSAEASGEDLRRFLGGEAIKARQVGRLERLWRRIRRRPGLSASIAIAILLVVVSLWLAGERLRADRTRQADLDANRRAAGDDLRDMVERLGTQSWTQARAALERAEGRLAKAGPDAAALRRSLKQGRRDLETAARLDRLRAEMALSDDYISESSDEAYANAFRSYGLGGTNEAPEVVASRIRDSNIRSALVDALDILVATPKKPELKAWMLHVARLSVREQSGWVALARDPIARRDRISLERLCETAPVDDEIVPLLLSVASDLAELEGDSIPFLSRIQEAHPSDFWANIDLANGLIVAGRDPEAIRYAQAAVACRPAYSVGYDCLGRALQACGKEPEAVRAFRTSLQFDPESLIARFNLGESLVAVGQSEEAVAYFREALKLNPQSADFHFGLATGLSSLEKYEEALVEYRRCMILNPSVTEVLGNERDILLRLSRRDEARTSWAAFIAVDPKNQLAWEGYAEFCLFIGNEEAYRLARCDLLDRFGGTAEFRKAEGIGRACLLLPATPEKTSRSTALVDRALADSRTKPDTGFYPYFMFAKGLAEYRMDRLDAALTIMRGPASSVLKPGPQLVEAMALHRLGHREEAEKTIAAAIGSYDWDEARAKQRDAWVYHILRREAEGLIGASEAADDEPAKK